MENASEALSGPIQTTPRRFDEIPGLWLQLPHMDQAFFAAEAPHASALNTFLAVMIYSVVATVAVVLVSLLQPPVGGAGTSSNVRTATLLVGSLTLFITPISFYLNTVVTYLAASIFGGKGKFSDQAYLASLFIVPIGFVSSLIAFIGLIPLAGLLIEQALLLIIVIFTTVLQYRVVRVVHNLSSGRTVGAVLVPFGLGLALACLGIMLIVVLVLMGPGIGNVFSSINQSLLVPTP